MFSGAQQDWGYCKMHFVNKPRSHILTDRRDTSTKPNILSASSSSRTLKRGHNSVSDKIESCTALHGNWRSCVMGQNEHRHVIGRIVTPPTFPGFVWPSAT